MSLTGDLWNPVTVGDASTPSTPVAEETPFTAGGGTSEESRLLPRSQSGPRTYLRPFDSGW